MSTAPIPNSTEPPNDLSREDWWALFDQLRLAQQPAYAEHGGPIDFLRKEREAEAA